MSSGYPGYPPNPPPSGGPFSPPPAGPYGNASSPYSNPYSVNPYGPPPPPPSSGTKRLWWFLGCGGVAALLLCCGSCGGFAFWGVKLTEQEIADQLRDNPKLVEKVGKVESFTYDWPALLGEESDDDHDVFSVRGNKGTGRVIVGHSSDFGEEEEIHSAVLVLPSGERVDLLESPPVEAN